MNLELGNKTILVSGGASGIGAAIVEVLREEGANAIPLDRTPCEGGVEIDLTDEQAIQSALAAIPEIHGIVNNVGLNDGVSLNSSPSDFTRSLEINLTTAFTLTHHALSKLKASRGAILNISSKVATTGQGGTSGYAAAKGGINALTREWAVDLTNDGIRVNCICPAEVMTPMYENWLSDQPDPSAAADAIASRIPLGKRFTTPREIADLTAFLISPRSSHTTGQILHPDGGYTHLDRSITP